MDNTAALERGFAKAKKIIDERMRLLLIRRANELCLRAHDLYASPKKAFTGNTWTGTAVGAYSNGQLIYYISTKMIASMPEVRRWKLKKGEAAYLSPDYAGNVRRFVGKIETDGGNSEQDALEFLQNHNPSAKYAICVVNGSEYANYIENVYGGDVIKGTYHYAHNLRATDISI